MSDVNEFQWYVMRAIGGKEKQVREYLEAEIRTLRLESHIKDVLIPTEKYMSVVRGKKVVKERVSYPGYVLVQCIMSGEIPHILRNIPGVLGFLSDSKKDSPLHAAPLREAEVKRILGQVDEQADAELIENEILYKVGETVKVIDGPFASLIGVVEEIDEQRHKLNVAVKIFGRRTPMELSYTQVEKDE
ncbi:MAG: transcription termination/antitermination protein NusG [Rikenellaceae bacterium]